MSLMGRQTVGLLNQKTLVMKQVAGPGLVGGGISGLAVDMKMTQPASIIKGLKSPKAPNQQQVRPQSFGLQSLLATPLL
jgi:hypothetical protein